MDIRKLLDALAPEDKEVWQRCRTDMRKAYINAHNTIHGVERWELEDDAFLDLIDIKIATLFDRNGKLATVERIIPSAQNIEDEIKKAVSSVDKKLETVMPSLAWVELQNTATGNTPNTNNNGMGLPSNG